MPQEYTHTSVVDDVFPGTYVVVHVRTMFWNRSDAVATHCVFPVVWLVTVHDACDGVTTIGAGVTFIATAEPTLIDFCTVERTVKFPVVVG